MVVCEGCGKHKNTHVLPEGWCQVGASFLAKPHNRLACWCPACRKDGRERMRSLSSAGVNALWRAREMYQDYLNEK